MPDGAEGNAGGAFGPLDAFERQRFGRVGGVLVTVGALVSLPAGLVLEPAPGTVEQLVGLGSILIGVAIVFVPWERLAGDWLHAVLVVAGLVVSLNAAISTGDAEFFFVLLSIYAAYVIRDRAVFVLYILFFTLGLLAPLSYAEGTQSHDIFLALPIFLIAGAVVRSLRDTMARRERRYLELAYEAVLVAERIRRPHFEPTGGQAGDLEERLGRLADP